MSATTGGAARRDARNDFLPGREKPAYRYVDHYYRGCYDLVWLQLEEEANQESERIREQEAPTLEERVETLEQQVQQLRDLIQP